MTAEKSLVALMVDTMRATQVRTLAIVAILLAAGTLAFAMASGGDIRLIPLGLILAASSMALFRRAGAEREGE